MRYYLIGSETVTVCAAPPGSIGESERVIASLDELRAARLTGKRLLAVWNDLPGAERLSEVANRATLIEQLWSALEALPEPQPTRASKQAGVIASCAGTRELRSRR